MALLHMDSHSHDAVAMVPAVGRALDLLELLVTNSSGLTLAELCRRLDIPKSSAHYLVQALVTRGYLQRVPGCRRYGIGSRTSDLGTLGMGELKLQAFMSPFVRHVANTTGLTTQLGLYVRGEGIVIDVADPPGGICAGTWVGRHFDLHCTAQGKALIAYLSDEELNSLFRHRGFARFTSKTTNSLENLSLQLSRVRAQGYAVNDEEHVLGFRGVAAPVFDNVRKVVASIAVRGSTVQIPGSRIPILGKELVATAKEISRNLVFP